MKKRILSAVSMIAISAIAFASATITLDECLAAAEANYPVIRKYDLVGRTQSLNLETISKSWLPKVGVYAQGTIQNAVPAYPDMLKHILAQNGADMPGLGKGQYKLAVELSQSIWDGDMSKSQRAVERAATAETEAAIAVEMYPVRERVENLYFGILLLNEQAAQIEATIRLLESNHGKICSMVRNGTAMQSDADRVEAQMLGAGQQLKEIHSAAEAYSKMLEVFMGETLDGRKLELPSAVIPSTLESYRPELTLFERRQDHNRTQNQLIGAGLMPRVDFFAQAYYGYPGFDYFKSMAQRRPTFNALAGIKVSWNIGNLYTRNASRGKLAVAASLIDTERELFLFNTRLSSERELAEIESVREVMKDDERIVALRESVRRAAESQLNHGVIDATSLLAVITDETQARLTAAYHRIQLIQNIYKLKYILNR